MKQLEQRVESLMGMLAKDPRAPAWIPSGSNATLDTDTTSSVSLSSIARPPVSHTSIASYTTPKELPHHLDPHTFTAYDPIEAGVVTDDQAAACLDEFRFSFCQQFPFVIVDACSARTLCKEKPFLFLAILTVTTYRTPTIQRILDEEFRDQVAIRIIGCAHKGLELLQGLLVHTAFYHFFYRPGKQQLTLMVQLCVAAVQDMGVSRNVRAQHNTDPRMAVVEKRAILGTYYLAAE